MLEVKNVSYAYKTKKDKTILNNVSATFEEGIFYTIVGPSGAGKTTLLSLLAGLDTAVKGTVLCNGEDITKKGLNYHRKHNISLVFQNYNLIDYMTSLESVMLTSKSSPLEFLKDVGITEEEAKRNLRHRDRDDRPDERTGGEGGGRAVWLHSVLYRHLL